MLLSQYKWERIWIMIWAYLFLLSSCPPSVTQFYLMLIVYWLTSMPDKFIEPSDWTPPLSTTERHFRLAPAATSATKGCVRIKIDILTTSIKVWLQKTDCTQTVNIGYLCEKQDPKKPGGWWIWLYVSNLKQIDYIKLFVLVLISCMLQNICNVWKISADQNSN